MSEIIEFIRESRHDKKKRTTVILVSLAVLFSIIILIRLLSGSEPPPPEGSLRVLICSKCNAKEMVRVKDMHKESYICPKCKAGLLKCLKCDDCGFEFPYKDAELSFSAGTSKAQRFNRLNELRKCPKCGSINAHIVSPSVLEKRNDKKTRKEE